MTINYNPVPLDYTDAELRTVVEEYIAAQKSEFSFKRLCHSVLHRAMDEGKTVDSRHTQYESTELKSSDGNRISRILWDMIFERRIIIAFGDNPYLSTYANDTRFVKI